MTTRKPPEGEGYDLQQVYAEGAKPFWFRWADEWWSLPHPKMLDFEAQLKVESFDVSSLLGDDEEDDASPKRTSVDVEAAATAKVDELFALIMDEQQAKEWAEVRPRPLPMMLDMLGKWTEHFKVDEGESAASTGSSKSTGRPSKRTSASTTTSASRKPSRARKAAAGRPANS